MSKLLFLLFVASSVLIVSAYYKKIIPAEYFDENGKCKYPYPACTIFSDY
jgi:hypothetical protein